MDGPTVRGFKVNRIPLQGCSLVVVVPNVPGLEEAAAVA